MQRGIYSFTPNSIGRGATPTFAWTGAGRDTCGEPTSRLRRPRPGWNHSWPPATAAGWAGASGNGCTAATVCGRYEVTSARSEPLFWLDFPAGLARTDDRCDPLGCSHSPADL